MPIDSIFQKDMLAWYHTLKSQISPEYITEKIILLGQLYIAEPEKYVAFIYLLSENNVTPEEMVTSGLLNQYFAYHIIDQEKLQETYSLMSTIPALKFHIEYFKTASCGLRGFINTTNTNDSDNDVKLFSYNIMGEKFEHTALQQTVNPTTLRKKIKTLFTSVEHGKQFFEVFGWKLVFWLHLQTSIHTNVFISLCKSDVNYSFFNEFTQCVLDGECDENIARIFDLMAEGISPTELAEIIKAHPFFIHTHNLNGIFEDNINNAIEKIVNDQRYKSIHHVSLLVALYQTIPCNFNADLTGNKILKMIMDIVLEYGNTIPDDIFDDIEEISEALTIHFKSTLSTYEEEVTQVMEQFQQEKLDYDTVIMTWASHLSQINLIACLYPEMLLTSSYPRYVYQLQSKMIYTSFLLEPTPLTFPLQVLLNKIDTNVDNQIRALKELICLYEDTRMAACVLHHLKTAERIKKFFFHPFGDPKILIHHLIDNKRLVLLKTVLKSVILTSNEIMDLVVITTNPRNINVFDVIAECYAFQIEDIKQLIKQLYFDTYRQNMLKYTQLIITLATDDKLPRLNSEDYSFLFISSVENKHFKLAESLLKFPILISKSTIKKLFAEIVWCTFMIIPTSFYVKICQLRGDHQQPTETYDRLFESAMKYKRYSLLLELCCLSGNNIFSLGIIQKVAIDSANNRDWDTAQRLCGMTDDVRINHNIVPKDNLKLYLEVLKINVTRSFNFGTISEKLLFSGAMKESLLQKLINNHCIKTITAYFTFFEKELSPSQIREILAEKSSDGTPLTCPGNTPEANRINYFLESKRKKIFTETRKRARSPSPSLFDIASNGPHEPPLHYFRP